MKKVPLLVAFQVANLFLFHSNAALVGYGNEQGEISSIATDLNATLVGNGNEQGEISSIATDLNATLVGNGSEEGGASSIATDLNATLVGNGSEEGGASSIATDLNATLVGNGKDEQLTGSKRRLRRSLAPTPFDPDTKKMKAPYNPYQAAQAIVRIFGKIGTLSRLYLGSGGREGEYDRFVRLVWMIYGFLFDGRSDSFEGGNMRPGSTFSMATRRWVDSVLSYMVYRPGHPLHGHELPNMNIDLRNPFNLRYEHGMVHWNQRRVMGAIRMRHFLAGIARDGNNASPIGAGIPADVHDFILNSLFFGAHIQTTHPFVAPDFQGPSPEPTVISQTNHCQGPRTSSTSSALPTAMAPGQAGQDQQGGAMNERGWPGSPLNMLGRNLPRPSPLPGIPTHEPCEMTDQQFPKGPRMPGRTIRPSSGTQELEMVPFAAIDVNGNINFSRLRRGIARGRAQIRTGSLPTLASNLVLEDCGSSSEGVNLPTNEQERQEQDQQGTCVARTHATPALGQSFLARVLLGRSFSMAELPNSTILDIRSIGQGANEYAYQNSGTAISNAAVTAMVNHVVINMFALLYDVHANQLFAAESTNCYPQAWELDDWEERISGDNYYESKYGHLRNQNRLERLQTLHKFIQMYEDDDFFQASLQAGLNEWWYFRSDPGPDERTTSWKFHWDDNGDGAPPGACTGTRRRRSRRLEEKSEDEPDECDADCELLYESYDPPVGNYVAADFLPPWRYPNLVEPTCQNPDGGGPRDYLGDPYFNGMPFNHRPPSRRRARALQAEQPGGLDLPDPTAREAPWPGFPVEDYREYYCTDRRRRTRRLRQSAADPPEQCYDCYPFCPELDDDSCQDAEEYEYIHPPATGIPWFMQSGEKFNPRVLFEDTGHDQGARRVQEVIVDTHGSFNGWNEHEGLDEMPSVPIYLDEDERRRLGEDSDEYQLAARLAAEGGVLYQSLACPGEQHEIDCGELSGAQIYIEAAEYGRRSESVCPLTEFESSLEGSRTFHEMMFHLDHDCFRGDVEQCAIDAIDVMQSFYQAFEVPWNLESLLEDGVNEPYSIIYYRCVPPAASRIPRETEAPGMICLSRPGAVSNEGGEFEEPDDLMQEVMGHINPSFDDSRSQICRPLSCNEPEQTPDGSLEEDSSCSNKPLTREIDGAHRRLWYSAEMRLTDDDGFMVDETNAEPQFGGGAQCCPSQIYTDDNLYEEGRFCTTHTAPCLLPDIPLCELNSLEISLQCLDTCILDAANKVLKDECNPQSNNPCSCTVEEGAQGYGDRPWMRWRYESDPEYEPSQEDIYGAEIDSLLDEATSRPTPAPTDAPTIRTTAAPTAAPTTETTAKAFHGPVTELEIIPALAQDQIAPSFSVQRALHGDGQGAMALIGTSEGVLAMRDYRRNENSQVHTRLATIPASSMQGAHVTATSIFVAETEDFGGENSVVGWSNGILAIFNMNVELWRKKVFQSSVDAATIVRLQNQKEYVIVTGRDTATGGQRVRALELTTGKDTTLADFTGGRGQTLFTHMEYFRDYLDPEDEKDFLIVGRADGQVFKYVIDTERSQWLVPSRTVGCGGERDGSALGKFALMQRKYGDSIIGEVVTARYKSVCLKGIHGSITDQVFMIPDEVGTSNNGGVVSAVTANSQYVVAGLTGGLVAIWRRTDHNPLHDPYILDPNPKGLGIERNVVGLKIILGFLYVLNKGQQGVHLSVHPDREGPFENTDLPMTIPPCVHTPNGMFDWPVPELEPEGTRCPYVVVEGTGDSRYDGLYRPLPGACDNSFYGTPRGARDGHVVLYTKSTGTSGASIIWYIKGVNSFNGWGILRSGHHRFYHNGERGDGSRIDEELEPYAIPRSGWKGRTNYDHKLPPPTLRCYKRHPLRYT